MAVTTIRTRVAASLTSVALVPSRARRSLKIHNSSLSNLYICEGAAASLTDYTQFIPAGGVWEAESPIYTGAVNGIWEGTTGAAQISEHA